MRWSIGSTGKQSSLGAFERNAQMNKTTPAALAALPEGSVLSLRTHPANPNHHLWWNNGTWWLHATVHYPDYTKQRLRLPLETKNVGLARSRRDAVLGAWSKEQRAWSQELRKEAA
jgi:hypothetical protein